jgi:enoyl-CoA hydratase
MDEAVSYRCEGGVARIVMDDGKVNAMSPAMLGEIDAALTRAETDQAIVVLRSGRPGLFSAGFDLKVFAAGDPDRSLAMVRAGAELALRLLRFPYPTLGVMEGHAFPMGAFLLLACDVRLAAAGAHRIGLNEVAIGITPPRFAIELARGRLTPAILSRTVTLGEMFEPQAATAAGFLDRVAAPEGMDAAIEETLAALRGVNLAMHALAKRDLRAATIAAMRKAIDEDLTADAYRAGAERLAAVTLPGRKHASGEERAARVQASLTPRGQSGITLSQGNWSGSMRAARIVLIGRPVSVGS